MAHCGLKRKDLEALFAQLETESGNVMWVEIETVSKGFCLEGGL